MTDRRMIYPYTLTAKVTRFPFKFYYNNSPYFKYFTWAIVACIPFFYKMQRMACSEANYIKYEEYRKKEREEIARHKEHLL